MTSEPGGSQPESNPGTKKAGSAIGLGRRRLMRALIGGSSYTTAISPKASAAPPLFYVLDGFVVGCTLGCDLALPPFPKFGFRSLHAATTSGSICGKALVACFRCGVSVIIGRMQSNMMPSPLLAPPP
jgi:hypothetical protein